jgi:hypothetical protein
MENSIKAPQNLRIELPMIQKSQDHSLYVQKEMSKYAEELDTCTLVLFAVLITIPTTI